jgi:L,D-peptidoglycan transpeptidase YkuD (ErfK/YbiS/YcfS/YnhG family)
MKKLLLTAILAVFAWCADDVKIDEAKLAPKIAATQTATKTDQIMLVAGDEFSAWQKSPKGWKMIASSMSGHGKNGFSRDRKEGSGTTPVGSFPLLYAFGTAEKSLGSMDYRQITPNSYLSGEADATYNTWVESEKPLSGDSEHLIDYYQYEWAMNIGFNVYPVVPGRGSAIFFHIKSLDHWYTAGCVSVPKDVMVKMIKWAKNGAYIIIVEDYSKLSEF